MPSLKQIIEWKEKCYDIYKEVIIIMKHRVQFGASMELKIDLNGNME